MTGPLAILPRNKDGHKTVTDFLTGFQEGDHVARACGTLHLQVITIVIVVPLQGLNDEVVDCVCVSACGEEGGGRGGGGGGEGEKRRRRRRGEEEEEEKARIQVEPQTSYILASLHLPHSHIGPLQLLLPPNTYVLLSPGT